MNQFLLSTKKLIARNGLNVTYKSITAGSYNVETGTSSATAVSHTVKSYPKQIIANQYNFPDLINKELIMFYIANDSLSFAVKLQDEIVYKGITYKIVRYQEHMAYGQVVLYIITAVKS